MGCDICARGSGPWANGWSAWRGVLNQSSRIRHKIPNLERRLRPRSHESSKRHGRGIRHGEAGARCANRGRGCARNRSTHQRPLCLRAERVNGNSRIHTRNAHWITGDGSNRGIVLVYGEANIRAEGYAVAPGTSVSYRGIVESNADTGAAGTDRATYEHLRRCRIRIADAVDEALAGIQRLL